MKVLLITLLVAAVSAVPIPDDNVGPVEMIVNGVAEGAPLELGEVLDVKLKEHTNEAVVATDLLHPFTAVGIAEAAAAVAQSPDAVQVADSEIPDAVILPAPAAPEVIIPDPVILPAPAAPEVEIPEAIILPAPAAPELVISDAVILPAPVAPEVEIPDAIILPAPAAPEVVIPDPVILPEPAAPEVEIPDAVILPEPAAPEIEIPDAVILPEPVEPEVVEDVPSPAAQDGEVYNDGLVSVSVNGPEETDMLSTLQSWFNMVINYFNDEGVPSSQQIV